MLPAIYHSGLEASTQALLTQHNMGTRLLIAPATNITMPVNMQEKYELKENHLTREAMKKYQKERRNCTITIIHAKVAIYILLILPWLCGTHPVMRNKLGTQLNGSQVEKRLVVPSTSGDAGLPNSRAVAPTVTTMYWPNGVIPYTFVYQGLSDHESGNYISNVREAMDWWQTSTCVQFIEVNTTTYNGTQTLPISLQKRNTKCTAYISYTQRFVMDLDEECLLDVGNLAHELGHIIGLIHEHIRYDRDNYIKVNFSKTYYQKAV